MIENAMQPNGDQLRAFRDRQTGEPIYMLNLLKFRERAVYEDGQPTQLTGAEAYAKYGEGVRALMEPRGVRIVYSGGVKGWLIGEGEGNWDAVAIVSYPSTQVMLEMMSDPRYQEIHKHRAAGLEGQLLIECGAGSL